MYINYKSISYSDDICCVGIYMNISYRDGIWCVGIYKSISYHDGICYVCVVYRRDLTQI